MMSLDRLNLFRRGLTILLGLMAIVARQAPNSVADDLAYRQYRPTAPTLEGVGVGGFELFE